LSKFVSSRERKRERVRERERERKREGWREKERVRVDSIEKVKWHEIAHTAPVDWNPCVVRRMSAFFRATWSRQGFISLL
jgi:hypothetical protein